MPSESFPGQEYHRVIAQAARMHMRALAIQITRSLPQVHLSELLEGNLGYHSIVATLPSGLEVLVSTDAQIPEGLFEVIRFTQAGDLAQYPFEQRVGLGSAFCDKLTTQAAVALLERYMQPDVLPPTCTEIRPAKALRSNRSPAT